KVELNYFHNRYQDVITLISDPNTGEGQFQNVGLTRARGLEASVQVRPVASVDLHAFYTLLDSKVLKSERPNDVLFGLGKPLLRRPRHSGSVGATLTWHSVAAGLTLSVL